MSEPTPVGAIAPERPDVRTAIARASEATGIDFAYLLGQAKLESSLNPKARAGTSSAAGLYQFTQGTWLATMDRHAASHGYGWVGAAIEDGRVRDPAMRRQILDLRFDPTLAALMAGELAGDNRDALIGVLGREPDAAEMYLAHFLGAEGASRFLTALAADPGQSAAALFPKAANANRGIFYTPSGAPRSLSGVMDLMRVKMARAMGDVGPAQSIASAGWEESSAAQGAWAEVPYRPASSLGGEWEAPHRPSMADTLVSTFGGNTQSAPAHIRAAYGKLKVFGL